MHRVFHLLFCLAVVALCAACPGAADEATVVDTCQKIAQKCRIANGQLGVCMMDSTGAFRCASQH